MSAETNASRIRANKAQRLDSFPACVDSPKMACSLNSLDAHEERATTTWLLPTSCRPRWPRTTSEGIESRDTSVDLRPLVAVRRIPQSGRILQSACAPRRLSYLLREDGSQLSVAASTRSCVLQVAVERKDRGRSRNSSVPETRI